MDFISLPYMDAAVSVFDVCQAYEQLEADYNVDGILRERPSNRRRRASIGVQLLRMGYNSGARWVDICAESDAQDDPGDEDVRDIYLLNVLKWGLPMDEQMEAFLRSRYTPEFLARFAPGRFSD